MPAYDLSGKRALIVTTSHGVLSEKVDDKEAKATGVFVQKKITRTKITRTAILRL
jgi:hypothetical protein